MAEPETAQNQQEERPGQGEVKPAVKKEEKQKSLEGILKTPFNVAVGSAVLAGAYALGGLDWLVTTASFQIGAFIENRLIKEKKNEEKDKAKKPYTSSTFANEAIGGLGFTVPLVYGVNFERALPQALGIDGLVNILGYSVPAAALAVGGLTFATIPLFNLVYYPITHLAHKKTFKGMGEDLKKNYWKDLPRSMALGIPWAAAVAASVAMPAWYPFLFPVLAGFEVAYRLVLSREDLDYKKLAKYANPLYYLGKLIDSVANPVAAILKHSAKSIYETGASLSSGLEGVVRTAAPAHA